jgi:hypothetical protein
MKRRVDVDLGRLLRVPGIDEGDSECGQPMNIATQDTETAILGAVRDYIGSYSKRLGELGFRCSGACKLHLFATVHAGESRNRQ